MSSPSSPTSSLSIPSFKIDELHGWETSPVPLPSPNVHPGPPPAPMPFTQAGSLTPSNSSGFIGSHSSSASTGSLSSLASLRTLVTLPSPNPSSSDFPPGGMDSAVLSPTSRASWTSAVNALPTRSNSVSSTKSNSSSKTDSFFSRGLGASGPELDSLTPPKPLPGSGSSLGRAGSVGRASLGVGGSAMGSRLAPASGARVNRSVSDATPRYMGGGGPGGSSRGDGGAHPHRPFFSFEKESPPPPPPVFTTSNISSLPSGSLPFSSSPTSTAASSGLPPPSLAYSHDLAAPSTSMSSSKTITSNGSTNLNREPTRPTAPTATTKEPSEGDELVEDVDEMDGPQRKRRRRRWRLVGNELGRGAFSCVWGARLEQEANEKEELRGLVAVKMMSKELCLENQRTLTSFTREVEILKTLHHPSIVSHLTSFSTPTHHILALPFLPGGELFSIVASPDLWSRVGMGWVRRVWGELEAAVGWLHAEGVVHRDVKLENVLLTIPLPTPSPTSTSRLLPKSAFPPPPHPLINLADFGLAKRLPPPPEPATLTTRCGSDSFACPEIIMGKEYDGRKADSWACGVVLFAMLTRSLPFGSPPTDDPSLEPPALRRSRMLRIAKGEYAWPPPLTASPPPDAPEGSARLCYGPGDGAGAARKVVEGLLKRDPSKRLRVGMLGEVGEAWLGEDEEEGDWGQEEQR